VAPGAGALDETLARRGVLPGVGGRRPPQAGAPGQQGRQDEKQRDAAHD
jgi:hypothetical protein